MAKANKSGKLSINFEGVQSDRRTPEGTFVGYPTEITQEKGEDSGKPYLHWIFEVTKGSNKGSQLHYNTSLQPKALWNLRGLLETMGQEVPDGEMDLDLKGLCDEDNEVGLVVEHETFEGRRRARIVDFIPADEVEAEGDADVAKDDKPDQDAVMEMDEEELEACIKEHDLDVDLDDFKKLKAKRAAVWEALEAADDKGGGDDDLPDDDAVDEMDEDELKAAIKEHGLDVKAKKFPKEKDLRKAVKAALEEKRDEDGGDKGDDEKYTEDAVGEMDKKELEEVIEKHDLEFEITSNMKKNRRGVLKLLKAADLIEED